MLKINSLRTGYHHVTFISRHPTDKDLCGDIARWWPEWHDCYLDNSNIPVYSARMLFSPKRKSDLIKYIL